MLPEADFLRLFHHRKTVKVTSLQPLAADNHRGVIAPNLEEVTNIYRGIPRLHAPRQRKWRFHEIHNGVYPPRTDLLSTFYIRNLHNDVDRYKNDQVLELDAKDSTILIISE